MELGICCKCIVTGWEAVDTNCKMACSDSVLGKNCHKGLNPKAVVRFVFLGHVQEAFGHGLESTDLLRFLLSTSVD